MFPLFVRVYHRAFSDTSLRLTTRNCVPREGSFRARVSSALPPSTYPPFCTHIDRNCGIMVNTTHAPTGRHCLRQVFQIQAERYHEHGSALPSKRISQHRRQGAFSVGNVRPGFLERPHHLICIYFFIMFCSADMHVQSIMWNYCLFF